MEKSTETKKKRNLTRLVLITVIITIVIRSFLEYLIPDLPTDKTFQITSAAHFSNGNGVSWAHPDTSDLSKTIYKKIGLWPPGYVLLISPFLVLGIDWLPASIIIEVFAICLLFTSLYLTLRLLETQISKKLIIVIFTYLAFAISPFKYLYSTDLLALAFFSFGLYGLFYIISNSTEVKLHSAIGVSFLFFSCSLFHYGFYSVSLAFPLILLLYNLSNSKSIKIPLVSIFTTLLFIALQIVYLRLFTGDSYYLNDYYPEPLSRIHFHNLLKFDPFIFNSFFDAHLVKKVLDKELFFYFEVLVTLVVLYLLFIGPLKSIYNKKLTTWNTKQWFFISIIILFFVKIFLLIALSLRYPAEYNVWSYVQESRYFSVGYLLIPLSLIMFHREFSKNNMRVMVVFLGFVLVSSLTVSLFLIKKYIGTSPLQNMCRYYHYSEELYHFIKDSRLKEKGDQLIFCNAQENNYIYELFSMEGIKMVGFEDLPKEINTSSDVTILIAVKLSPEPEVQKFIHRYKSKRVLQLIPLNSEIWELSIPKNI